MTIICFVLFRDDIQDKLSVFPTIVVKEIDSQSIVDTAASVYFEKRLIWDNSGLLRAAVTVFSLFYVFDVRFAAGLRKTINFLDVFVRGCRQKN